MKMCRVTEVQEACRTFDVSVKKTALNLKQISLTFPVGCVAQEIPFFAVR